MKNNMSPTLTRNTTILSNEESDKLIIAFAKGSESFTEDEAVDLIKWATQVTIDYTILQLVYDGTLKIQKTEEKNNYKFSLVGKINE